MLPKEFGSSASKKPGQGNRGDKGASGRIVGKNSQRDNQTRDARVAPKQNPPAKNRDDVKKKQKNKVSDKNKEKKLSKKKPSEKVKSKRPKPKKPTKVDPAPLVKTKQTGVATTGIVLNNNIVEQERDILNAFLTLSGTELFQYTNQQSVDGQFSDVSIISVLSSRRKDYSPNDIINLYPAFVKDVYKGSGADAGKLFFEVDGVRNGGSMTVEFYISSGVAEIGSVDFV